MHVRPPRRIVGVGGDGDPTAKLSANREGLLRLKEQVERALAADEGMASSASYYEIGGRRFELFVMRCTDPRQMGEAREPERPDRSMFA